MVALETTTSTSVLVAEDDRVISDVIRFNLERARYAVTIARNGTEAWSLLQSRNFDVLVTDYQMPGMTGEEVCRTFRQTYPQKHLPVIFLSARGLELNVARMQKELGIVTLLYKPFSPRELIEEIAKCARKSPTLP
jgi:CheY-like chemotaxis protein